MASFLRCGRRLAAVAATRTFTFQTLHVAAPLRALRGPVTVSVLQGRSSLVPQRRLFASEAVALSLKDVEDRILDVLKKFDKVDPSKVHVDAHLVNDLGLDSLDVVEVVMAFEDEFSIEVNDTDAENVLTVQDAIKLVSKQLGVQAA